MDWLLRILEGLIIGIGIPFCLHLLASKEIERYDFLNKDEDR